MEDARVKVMAGLVAELGNEWTLEKVEWFRTSCPGCRSRVRIAFSLSGTPWALCCLFCKHITVLRGSERHALGVGLE